MNRRPPAPPSLRRHTIAAALGCALWVCVAPATRASGLGHGQTARLLSEGDEALASARRQLQQGHAQVAASRLREAARAFNAVLADDDNNRHAVAGAAAILYLTKRHEEAVALLEPLAERFREDIDIAHQLGLNLYRLGRHEDAMLPLARAAADPARFDAMWLLAIHHYRRAAWAQGLRWAERYASARPDDLRGLGLLGTLYLKTERYDEAVDALGRFVEGYPDNVAARINRANALLHAGRQGEAASEYEALLAEYPDRLRLAYNLAAIRIRQDRCGDALPLLARFVADQADHATALYFKGDCEVRLGRAEEARATMARVVELAPSNPWAHHALARLEYATGDLDAALQHARRAAEVSPGEWEIATSLGTLLRRAGAPDEALGWHDRAAQAAPHEARVHSERGRDLWLLDRVEDATAAFGQAVDSDGEDMRARESLAAGYTALAVAARRSHELESARTLLRQALDASAGYPAAVVNLTLLELGAGAAAAATAAIDEAPSPSTPEVAVARAAVHLADGQLKLAAAAADDGLTRGTQLASLAHEIKAHAAAAAGDWETTVAALESAAAVESSGNLDAARAFAQLALGLQRLGAGEASRALAPLDAAADHRDLLTSGDLILLDFARAAARVASQPRSDKALRALESLVSGRRLARHSHLRDRGWVYVAWARLLQGKLGPAQAALKRAHGRQADSGLGLIITALERAIRDAEGRQHFEAGRYAKALAAWEKAPRDEDAPILTHNKAAARAALGDLAGARGAWDAQAAAATPPEALYNLAVLADRDGRLEEAYSLFRSYAGKGSGQAAATARERAQAKQRVLGLGGGS